MHKFKRYGLKKWKLIQSRQLRRLWTGLFLIFLLCVTFQVVQKFQRTSKCQLKQLSLQQSTAHENSLQDNRDPNSAHLFSKTMEKSITSRNVVEQLMPGPSLAEKKRHIMKLSKAFNQTKLLDSSVGSEEEFWQKPFVTGTQQVQMLHFKKRPEDLNHHSKNIPAKDAVTFSANRELVTVTKAGTFLIKMNNFTTKMNADDQAPGVNGLFQSPTETSSSPIHHRSKSSRVTKTISQNFSIPKDKNQSEKASSEMDSGVPLPDKTVLPTVGRMIGANMTDFSQGTTCKPRTHIVFLKVHKSASSTVMNILFRFGETHNLTFALPINGGHQLNYPYYFTAEAVEPLSPSNGSQFNIMCHHMRFFKPEIAKVMLNSTFYFSILRNPVQLMESSFTYYKGTSVFSKAKNLEEFLNQSSQFYNASATDSHYAKNLMTFDFGYNHNGNFSAKHIQLMLQAIEAEFDLLLISEYFDESMVMLKETLCWDLDDVIFFPLNSRHNSTKNPLSERVAEKIKSWNKLDWAIYVHFNRTFWKKIDRNIGRERMQNEVRTLQQKREQLAKICLQGSGSVAPQLIRDQALAPLQYGRAVIMGYNLKPRLDKTTRQMCQRMVTPELQYNRLLYRKQFPKKALKPSNIAILPKLSDRRAV